VSEASTQIGGASSTLAGKVAEPTRHASDTGRRAKAPLDIPSLDGLRAFSFLSVFLAHAGVSVMPGGFGVTVFFFLSGYLITTLIRREMEETGRVSLRHFYLRRVLRILPPFYILLATATALAAFGVIGGDLRLGGVMSQALHYSNYWIILAHSWSGIAAGTGVLWSLAVEEHFYLGFPALFVVLYRAGIREKKMALAFFAICAAVLVWRTILVFVLHAPLERTFIATDTRLDSMLFGCALAVWRNPALDDTDKPLSPLFARVLLPLGVVVLLGTFLIRSDDFRDSVRYSLQGLGLYPIFVTAIKYPRWIIYRFLNVGWVRHIGLLSYSLYLGHHVILYGVERYLGHAGELVVAVVALPLAVLFAEAMYHFVEKPCARLRRRFSKVS
jgi:peptidoglycan/LPS O-acetylase OafA/YrhL